MLILAITHPLAVQVRGAVCANINLLMEKEEEDFEKYLPTFAADVWGLLTGVTLEPCQVVRVLGRGGSVVAAHECHWGLSSRES